MNLKINNETYKVSNWDYDKPYTRKYGFKLTYKEAHTISSHFLKKDLYISIDNGYKEFKFIQPLITEFKFKKDDSLMETYEVTITLVYDDIIKIEDWSVIRQKCIEDKTRSYMIENFLTIYSPSYGGYVPFKLYNYQKEILKSFTENQTTLVKSNCRQMGITILEKAYIACEMVLNPSNKILYLRTSRELGKDFLKDVKDFIKQIPIEIFGEPVQSYLNSKFSNSKYLLDHIFIQNNENKIKLINGSCLSNINALSPLSGLRGSRGDTDIKYPTHIIIDNAAWGDMNVPSIKSKWVQMFDLKLLDEKSFHNVKEIISNTGNREVKNFFSNLLKEVENGEHENAKIIEINWWQNPIYRKDISYFTHLGATNSCCLLPSSPWYNKMCEIYNYNKERIEAEIGIGYNKNVLKNEIKSKIEFLENEIKEKQIELNRLYSKIN